MPFCRANHLHQEYYGCDAVYYLEDKDRVREDPLKPILKKNSLCTSSSKLAAVWLKKIRIHLEHENDINDSWQEIAQFCVIPGCELNVLVTYPDDNEKQIQQILKVYADMLNQSYFDAPVLVIFGFLSGGTIKWQGYKFDGKKEGRFSRINADEASGDAEEMESRDEESV